MGLNLKDEKASIAQENEGTVVHLQNVRGEPIMDGDKPVTVRIAGSYSAPYRKTQAAQTQRLLNKRRQKFTEEEFAANRAELVAACVLEWSGIDGEDGKPLPCTPINALKLVTDLPHVRDQLEEAQADHASFSKPASPT